MLCCPMKARRDDSRPFATGYREVEVDGDLADG
jgi:hypothetical protein